MLGQGRSRLRPTGCRACKDDRFALQLITFHIGRKAGPLIDVEVDGRHCAVVYAVAEGEIVMCGWLGGMSGVE